MLFLQFLAYPRRSLSRSIIAHTTAHSSSLCVEDAIRKDLAQEAMVVVIDNPVDASGYFQSFDVGLKADRKITTESLLLGLVKVKSVVENPAVRPQKSALLIMACQLSPSQTPNPEAAPRLPAPSRDGDPRGLSGAGCVQPVEAVSEFLPDGLHDLDLSVNRQCFYFFRCHGSYNTAILADVPSSFPYRTIQAQQPSPRGSAFVPGANRS